MIFPARKDLTALRWQPFQASVSVVGVDFGGASFQRFQVRAYPDAADPPLVDLDGNAATGQGTITLTVTTANSVPTSRFDIVVNEAVVEGLLPFAINNTEPGQDVRLTYDFVLTKAGVAGGRKSRWQEGAFIIRPGVTQA